jgi:hypothetical protein
LVSHVLMWTLAFCSSTPQERMWCGRNYMETVSDSRTSERAITDVEFELLLQKTYEMVQAQKPLEPSAESTSWT